jgi:hypothetical protein
MIETRIKSIKKIQKTENVYDIEVANNHNYFAEGHLVHNCHRLVLQGLFGSVKEVVRTKDLIDKGAVATFNVKALVLNHTNEAKTDLRKKQRGTDKARKYALEKDFLVNLEKRNIFIRNLAWSLEGQNNLILFDLVEKHGKVLEPLLRREDRVLHFIHGGTNATQREHIRHLIENDPLKRHDILASPRVAARTNLRSL